MKGRAVLVSVLALGLVLGLAAGFGVAQGPGPQGDTSALAVPAGTSFTYQGRLTDGGADANGSYDLEFELHDHPSAYSQVGSTVTKGDVAVTDGVFTVELDFGSGVFAGDARWLEIAVRRGDSTGAYTTLAPRQALTAAPYAVYALGAAWSGLTGVPPGFADGVDDVGTAGAHDHWGESWGGSGIGLTLDSSDEDALRLSGGDDGLQIESAADDGVFVKSAGEDGVLVQSAGRDAFSTVGAGGDGLYVKQAGDDGVDVRTAGDNGVYVESAGGNGVHVSAAYSGVRVESAGTKGVYVLSAGGHGVYVSHAGANGLQVGTAVGDGVHVESAGNDGVYGRSTASDGRGVVGVASGDSSNAHGVYGDSASPYGFGGYFTNSGGGMGLFVDGDAAQSWDGYGFARAGAYLRCGQPAHVQRYFNTVNGSCRASSPRDGECEIDFDFDLTNRFWAVAGSGHIEPWDVGCIVYPFTPRILNCTVFDHEAVLRSEYIMVIVY